MNKRKNRFGCQICGKGVQFANKVSHAKNRTHIIRRPNLQSHTIIKEGKKVKMKLCVKCKRKMRREERELKAKKK